jgi:uncharacterized protein (DUF2249 family)
MSTLTDAIRQHHRSLARTLAVHAQAAATTGVQTGPDSFVAFLKRDLLPHARGEERHLYPAVDDLLRQHGRATTTMSVDHEFIGAYVAKIDRLTRELASASVDAEPRLREQLRNLANRLDAVVEVHLAKEERIYLPLIEQHLDDARQRELLGAIHGSYEEEKKAHGIQPLDVRNVAPRERHTLIFDTFAALRDGEAFELINDHDPRPLYYQFQAEHAGHFLWEYLEQGPEVWRVRIGRRA